MSPVHSAYYTLYRLYIVGCFAHARRGFTDALKALPKDSTIVRTNAEEGLEFLNALFKLEKKFKDENLSPEERHERRKKESEPLL